MTRKIWAFTGGLFLTTLLLVIGLWANFQISGDPLALAKGGGSPVEATSILFTSLFVGLSGGHYIGGSFDDGDGRRMFALGANTVLWATLVGFVVLQFRQGGDLISPMMYSAFLILSGGGIFALHRAELIQDESRFDEYITLFSSQGTSVVVIATLIIRSAPDPFIASAIVVGAVLTMLLIWNAYGEYVNSLLKGLNEKIENLRKSDGSEL